jgi:serpin B
MTLLHLLLLIVGIMILAKIDCVTAQPAQTNTLAARNTAFALDLYGHLKGNQGNLFFSPYSISTCLAMTYAGARGETENQMAKVFRFDKDQQKLHSSFGELERRLNEAGKQKGIELSIANALWAQKGHPFLPDFLNIAKGQYQANINQADFRTEAQTVTAKINQWVAEKTKEKIQNILPPGSLDALTRLVLANAIYFKGTWAKQFDTKQTATQPFHLSATDKVDVPLMHLKSRARYMENSDLQAVELFYSSNQLSMVILLPSKIDGCSRLESSLDVQLLSTALSRMIEKEVEMLLPRFKLQSGFKLNGTLAEMGMTNAFSDKADFSGIDGTRLLYISDIFHKAWGEVNEEGTEAAAATVVGIRATSARLPEPTPIFRADHPFVFLIRDSRSGSLLFLGRLSDPTK